MAQTVCPLVSAVDRRARIILHSVERVDVAEVARRAASTRPSVWRWQRRFAEAGVDGLLRDKTRKPGKPRTADATCSGWWR